MGSTERRQQVLELLRSNKQLTINELADRFGVSARTIQRDIVDLSFYSGIYTTRGRTGGVLILEKDSKRKDEIHETDIKLLLKLKKAANYEICILSREEEFTLDHLITVCSNLYTYKR